MKSGSGSQETRQTEATEPRQPKAPKRKFKIQALAKQKGPQTLFALAPFPSVPRIRRVPAACAFISTRVPTYIPK